VTLTAVAVAFVFRILAVREHWPSIVPVGCPPENSEVVPIAAPTPGNVARR